MNNLQIINFSFLNKNSKLTNGFLPNFIHKAKKTLNQFVNPDYSNLKENLMQLKQIAKKEETLKNFKYSNAKIKVLFIGGAGNNVLKQFSRKNKIYNQKVEFLALNTERKALDPFVGNYKTMLIGQDGLGSGSNPIKAQQLTQNHEIEIKSLLQNSNLIVLVAAVGKGTGSGATSIIARYAKDLNIPVLSLVFYPSDKFYNQQKIEEFNKYLALIEDNSDSHLIINNNDFIDNVNASQETFYRNANTYLIQQLELILKCAGSFYNNVDTNDFISFIKNKKLSVHQINLNILSQENVLNEQFNKNFSISSFKNEKVDNILVLSEVQNKVIYEDQLNLKNKLTNILNNPELNINFGEQKNYYNNDNVINLFISQEKQIKTEPYIQKVKNKYLQPENDYQESSFSVQNSNSHVNSELSSLDLGNNNYRVESLNESESEILFPKQTLDHSNSNINLDLNNNNSFKTEDIAQSLTNITKVILSPTKKFPENKS